MASVKRAKVKLVAVAVSCVLVCCTVVFSSVWIPEETLPRAQVTTKKNLSTRPAVAASPMSHSAAASKRSFSLFRAANDKSMILGRCPELRSLDAAVGAPQAVVDAWIRKVELFASSSKEVQQADVAELLSRVCDMRFSGNPGKVTRAMGAERVHWLRTSGLLRRTTECPSDRYSLEVPGAVFDTNNSAEAHWRDAVRRLKPMPLGEPLPPASITQSQFVRAPKTASWVVGRDICASCESSRAFFMNPRHSCYFTLWGVGSAAPLKRLVSASRAGRNAIFKEREGSFRYGGVIPMLNASVREHATYLRGTTVWHGAFEVDNVGHVIHDALWAFQLVLMLRELLGNKGGDASSLPLPLRGVFGDDFDTLSSDYFGALSWMIAKGERQENEHPEFFRSPFTPADILQHRLVCFETLVVPGQDRHIDGGGNGLRSSVAARLRRHVFAHVRAPTGATTKTASTEPHIYVYGRNDVHRRSFDNVHALLRVAARVAKALSLPSPRLISTFSVPAAEQIALMRDVDVLLAIQGSHMQNSLFMPDDGVVIELAPCRAQRVSFIQRYGKYLDTQSYEYIPLCDGVVVNYSDLDEASQNVTLCPHMLDRVEVSLLQQTRSLVERRKQQRGDV